MTIKLCQLLCNHEVSSQADGTAIPSPHFLNVSEAAALPHCHNDWGPPHAQ